MKKRNENPVLFSGFPVIFTKMSRFNGKIHISERGSVRVKYVVRLEERAETLNNKHESTKQDL